MISLRLDVSSTSRRLYGLRVKNSFVPIKRICEIGRTNQNTSYIRACAPAVRVRRNGRQRRRTIELHRLHINNAKLVAFYFRSWNLNLHEMIYSQSSTRKFTHSINTPPKSNQSFKLEHEPITPDSDCHGTPNFLSHAPITPNSESLSHKNITPDSETLHGLPKSNESSSAGVKRVINISEPAPASTKSNNRPKGWAVARREI